ncbi:MAG: hypothetical protein Q4D81_11380 [Eubacteriales bacterium]|nr:hypothetical protein [Eubacteriales bacterium]
MYDHILRNGRLTDRANGYEDACLDLAVQDGVIAKIAQSIEGETKNEIDLKGLTLTPGLIDYHAHFFSGGTNTSLEFAVYPATGVTFAVDAGSAGPSNLESFLRVLTEREKRHAGIFLNVSSEGLSCLGDHPENIHPAYFNEKKIVELCRRYPGLICGIKVRISEEICEISNTTSFDALRAAIAVAQSAGLRVSVHMPNFQGELSELIDILRPWDIFCHVFTPQKGIQDGDGISKEVFRGREKGILFESACGKGHLGHEIAKKAIAAGFLPDIISGDLTRNTFGNRPAVSLPWLMSRFIAMGMSFADVLETVTTTPAALIGKAGRIGALKEGAAADLAVFRMEEGEFVFEDARGDRLTGNTLLVPAATMMEGEWAFNNLPYLQ